MIIHVAPCGRDAAGLSRYLFGPGKANEHTNQRMLAGSPELHGEWGDAELTSRQATHVGRLLEASWRRQYAPELVLAGQGAGGISRGNLTDGEDAVPGRVHVFHVSLSLHSDDAPLTDAQWGEVAETYMRGMGFIDNPEHPDATWMAVHHGSSAAGNDHIHIAMCTTLRNGATLDVHNSGLRSQGAPREAIERLPYVKPLHDGQARSNTPTLKPFTAAEHNIARERHRADPTQSATPDRVVLQRLVRAAADRSTTEAEWFNHLLSHRGFNVEVKAARWQPGTNREVVTGYKVRLGEGPWLTGSQLASDLTLQKMRAGWTETPQSRELAGQLWREDASKLDPLPESPSDVDEHLEAAAEHLRAFNASLADLDPMDPDAWATPLASVAGTTALLATGTETVDLDGRPTGFGHEAGRAADVLARQHLEDAWTRGPARPEPQVPGRVTGPELAARHVQLAMRAASPQGHRGWLAVIQQLNRTVTVIRDAREARNELAAARALSRDVLPALDRLERFVDAAAPLAPVAAEPSSRPTGRERDSERLLRESQQAAGRQTGPGTEEISDDARRARRDSSHGRRGVTDPGERDPGRAAGTGDPAAPTSPPKPGRPEQGKRPRGPSR